MKKTKIIYLGEEDEIEIKIYPLVFDLLEDLEERSMVLDIDSCDFEVQQEIYETLNKIAKKHIKKIRKELAEELSSLIVGESFSHEMAEVQDAIYEELK